MTTWGAPATRQTYESWTDRDLFRAIEMPEITEPGLARDAEIAEYVQELQLRKDARESESATEARLREKYQI